MKTRIDDYLIAIFAWLLSQWRTGGFGMSFEQAKRIVGEYE